MTLNRPIVLAAALLLSASALAETVTGSGKMATENRAVSGYKEVGIAVPGKVKLTQGATESLTITADDNVLPLIESVVENGALKIRFRKEQNLSINKVKIEITLAAKTLEALSIAGSGDLVSGPLKSGKLALNIGGSGNATVESVAAADVAINIGGSGDVAIKGGAADDLKVSIGGSGQFDAPKLQSRRAKLSIAGSGDAKVWAKDTLSVTVAGSGSVKYYGDPEVKRTVIGSGDVKRAGASPS